MSTVNYSRFFSHKPSANKSNNILEVACIEDLPNFLKIRPNSFSKEQYISIFQEWNRCLFVGNFNLIIRGLGSKIRLLDTYMNFLQKYKYKENQIRVRTIRLHGLSSISEEFFCANLFGDVKKATSKDLKRLSDHVSRRSNSIQTVFIIHSVELFLKESQAVATIVFKLCRFYPTHFKLIMSADHINSSGTLLYKYRICLKTLYFDYNTEVSFLLEKLSASTLNETCNNILDSRSQLESLDQIYSAIQSNCRKIMRYIMEYRVAHPSASLKMDELRSHCSRSYFIHRAQVVKDHLGELSDHSIVMLKSNSIKILIEADIARKFLETHEAV